MAWKIAVSERTDVFWLSEPDEFGRMWHPSISECSRQTALASVHGVGKIEASMSDFYLVDEIQGTYRGMMISLPPTAWLCFGNFASTDFVLLLQDLASKVNLTRFLKQPRKEKKNRPPLVKDPKHPHVSTAKLLSDR